jgi:valyl-tRNA synthetase
LLKDLGEVNNQIERLKNLLSSAFSQKAPPEVVQKEEVRLASFEETAEKIKSQLAELE